MNSNVTPFPGGAGQLGGSRLPPDGGGPHDPNMEARLTKLEDALPRIEAAVQRIADDVAGTKRDVAELRKELSEQGKSIARLDGRVSQLPTTIQLIGFVLAVLALAGLSRYLAP